MKEIDVPNILKSGTFPLCDCTVNRLGHGAMQPAGAGAFGPKEPAAAREVASSTAGAPRNNRLATSPEVLYAEDRRAEAQFSELYTDWPTAVHNVRGQSLT